MTAITYSNIYNFSIDKNQGFTATITFVDNLNQPLFNPLGCSASMILLRAVDNFQEFNWTTANNKITMLAGPQAVINVPVGEINPSVWILQQERYPMQNYTYTFTVFDISNTALIIFTGNFIIYNLG
jgi:hypothetical protein